MAGSGFEQMDFLQCCKFAEGDSRILMLKMARYRLRAFQKEGPSGHSIWSLRLPGLVMYWGVYPRPVPGMWVRPHLQVPAHPPVLEQVVI